VATVTRRRPRPSIIIADRDAVIAAIRVAARSVDPDPSRPIPQSWSGIAQRAADSSRSGDAA
jgi:hypothetical protein